MEEIKIPEFVLKIGNGAFSFDRCITRITIPSSVYEVGINPFSNCDSLEYIYVEPDNERYAHIDGVLFDKDNKALVAYPVKKADYEHDIPNGIAQIGTEASEDNEMLNIIHIRDTVKYIDEEAFYSCSSLSEVTIPLSVVQVGERAFLWVPTRVTVPEFDTKIGESAFYGNDQILVIQRDSYVATYAKNNNV